ncbi:MAG TPA: hypothetical protein VHO67_00755 [Polyangia bacterium]|nr:hypothetical protein [Polyangia bacterium]
MEDDDFDEASFFRRVAGSGARAVLIGRRALIALGIPLLTADYDFWIHVDDIETFNAALEPLGLSATHSPAEARGRGRYVLENGEHVDVLVGRSVPTVDGARVTFDEVWARRVSIDLAPGVAVAVPCLDDLEATKRFAARPKDAEDIRLLQALRRERGER